MYYLYNLCDNINKPKYISKYAKIESTRDMEKTQISDCVACLLKPILRFGQISGYNPISITCPHSETATSRANFKKSAYIYSYTILLTVVLMALVLQNIFKILLTPEKTPDYVINDILELMLSLNGVTCAMMALTNYSDKLIQLNGLVALIDARQHYGFSTILDVGFTKKCVLLGHFVNVSTIIMNGTFSIALIFDNYAKTTAINIAFLVIFNLLILVIQGSFFFQCLMFSYLYKCIFKICFTKITTILKARLEIFESVESNGKQEQEVSVEAPIKKLSGMYSSLVYNYRQENLCLNPGFCVWWVFAIGVMILNSYLIVLVYNNNGAQNYLLNARTYLFMACLVLYMEISEGINVVNQDILSFLCKYPISKLTTAEAVQVEMLLTTLTVHKPVFNASDIFVVGTKLLASMSGTIVTYALVGLQFRASSTKRRC